MQQVSGESSHRQRHPFPRSSTTSPRTDPVTILLRTRANRWTVRTHRSCVVLGIITLVTDLPRPAYRTVRLDPASGDRILLRDTAALEEAFAVLLAGLEHSRIAAAAPPADAASASAAIDRPLEFEDAA
ncbi:hypothetical protein C5C00_08730 [Rathayibacter rathayi]|nr:hypothetical protein C5C47_08390 [Rathayibacter rathayi]PPG96467.1 hypothetical protein C5C00_08730 [Rathayibacter rathayi]